MQLAEQQSTALQNKTETADYIDTTTCHDCRASGTNVWNKRHTQRSKATPPLPMSMLKLQGLNAIMAQQTDQLQQQHETIDVTIATALLGLQQQTDKLAATAQDAGNQADVIQQQDKKLQRDYFFNATKFIVESLHSLALDFTRMLDGELPEKTWKAYQRGDTSVFTKRLVSLRDTLSHDKIRQKFADDVEFRTYVQRYLRQFDEIHTHAKQQDYGDLLSGVFTSSDIGRLFQMLTSILDRN